MTHNTGNIKVVLEGRGPLTLRASDYVATGGEASVYRAGGTSVKLYTDPQKMRRDGIPEKVKLLQPLKTTYIIAPEGLVTDPKGQPIGIYMPFAEGEPMPRVFTNGFRTRESFGDTQARILADRMRDVFRFAHDHRALLVDPNEMNWIVAIKGVNGPEPRAIDVDSWAIGRFGPKAIMPSIQDWHSKGFTESSDWFAWAVVTFQIFTGIHPYRGTLAGYTVKDLERRMKDNASVFTPGIGLNVAVRDFNCIPGPLFEWYKSVFVRKERSMPPSPLDTGAAHAAPAARVLRVTTTASGSLIFEKIFDLATDEVIRVWPCGAVLTKSGAVYDLATKRAIGTLLSPDASEVIKVKDGWVLADWSLGAAVYTFVEECSRAAQVLPFSLTGYKYMRFANRLFLVTESELVELDLLQMSRPLLTIGKRTSVLSPKSTKWLDGVGIQEAFGAKFMIAPFGDTACATVRVRELDGIVPLAAEAGDRFVTVIGLDKTGAYRKIEFTFAADYSSYTVWEGSADSAELNIAILPKGVCAIVVKDGELVIFVPRSGVVNRVSDKQIATDMAFANWNDTVVYIQNGAVWSVKMK